MLTSTVLACTAPWWVVCHVVLQSGLRQALNFLKKTQQSLQTISHPMQGEYQPCKL